MDLQLRNKTALVTGSTAGIGFAIASLLAKEGASVVVNGRTSERVQNAVDSIRNEQKSDVRGVAADLGTKEGLDQVIKSVPSVDILVKQLGHF